ncbi:MAG: hypothetical protein LC799_13880, partial [Actinobacteria bacterium]|nr:hypothetical protein [Actinomycetota bacterium]
MVEQNVAVGGTWCGSPFVSQGDRVGGADLHALATGSAAGREEDRALRGRACSAQVSRRAPQAVHAERIDSGFSAATAMVMCSPHRLGTINDPLPRSRAPSSTAASA